MTLTNGSQFNSRQEKDIFTCLQSVNTGSAPTSQPPIQWHFVGGKVAGE
jgi:hypothetical protein